MTKFVAVQQHKYTTVQQHKNTSLQQQHKNTTELSKFAIDND